MCHQMYGVSCIIERLHNGRAHLARRSVEEPPIPRHVQSPHLTPIASQTRWPASYVPASFSTHGFTGFKLSSRLFSLGGTGLEASGRLRRTGRPRYRHPLSLALSLNPPILLLSRLPFTQGAPGQGRQRLRGHGWCDLPGSGRRAGKGRRRREASTGKLNLDANHNLRSKQGSKTVFPHPYTFDI